MMQQLTDPPAEKERTDHPVQREFDSYKIEKHRKAA